VTRRRFALLGFTEAELGFVMAALFLAIAATKAALASRGEADQRRHGKEVDSLAMAIEDTVSHFRALLQGVSRERDSLLLKSRITPTCGEENGVPPSIAVLTVVSQGEALLDGKGPFPFGAIRTQLAGKIAEGSRRGCLFPVEVRSLPVVPGPAFIAATERIQALQLRTRLRQ
jgi:hypothetical protein